MHLLLLVDEAEDGDHAGHLGWAPRRRWPCGGASVLQRVLLSTTNTAREEGKVALEGGNGLGRPRGVSRRRKRARGGLESSRRRRGVHGWLGGFPPSSLGAQDREEDPAAPGGPAGL